MALKQVFDIRIETAEGTLLINKINELEVESTWQNMSATGWLKVARKNIIEGTKSKFLDLVVPGCKIVIKCGYMAHNIPVKHRYVTEFIGYISSTPQPYAPIEMQLEDAMYNLKRKQVKTRTFSNHAKLADVVKYVASDYVFDCVDTTLSKTFIVDAGSAARALQKIEETYAIKSFFRLIPDTSVAEGARQVLIVGKPYSSNDLAALTPADDIIYAYKKNVNRSDLKYTSANEKRVLIQVPVKLTNDKDYTYQVGDADGVVIKTRELTNATPLAVKAFAERELREYKVDKFSGSFTSLGFPYVRHGRVVRYSDWRFGNRAKNTRYFVDKTKVNAGVSGYRRTVTLGWLAANNTTSTSR